MEKGAIKMRSPWIILVEPIFNDKYPHRRNTMERHESRRRRYYEEGSRDWREGCHQECVEPPEARRILL